MLRLIEPTDAPALYRFFDENFLFLSPWVAGMDRPVTEESTMTFVNGAVEDATLFNAVRLLIIAQDEIAGVVSVNHIDAQNASAEIGYILGERFTKQGLATAACKACIDLCFSDFALNRIEIAINETNIESHKVAKRLGATPEGLRRQGERIHGEYVNQLTYSILKSDWVATIRQEVVAA